MGRTRYTGVPRDCKLPDCPVSAASKPAACLFCGWRSMVHAMRVDDIHKHGLRWDRITKLMYLPVRTQAAHSEEAVK